MVRSKNLERTGSNEICRKFLLVKGISIFGIGHILAIFHSLGKMECSNGIIDDFCQRLSGILCDYFLSNLWVCYWHQWNSDCE